MKYKLAPTSIYKRAYKSFIKKHPGLEPKIREKLEFLQNNPQDPLLKTHHLTGRLKGLKSFILFYEYRIVFRQEGDIIYLLNIGSHDEVY
jgi:addiction module RelE/StbE family toxin